MSFTSSNSICRVAVDAMGGDFAPHNAVLGAVEAQNVLSDVEVFLIGKKDLILNEISQNNLTFNEDRIINAEQVIDMHDKPTEALKSKPDSSIVVGARMLREKKIDAFLSAGNTGAMMAASTLISGRIKGVSRPTIGASFPTDKGKFCNVYDVGASVDSKPEHLFEYAIMGSIFTKEIFGIENPSIGILSVGEEDEKGNELVKAASKLIKNSNLNFYGNVEGRDILKGTVDVVVCDGFVGNILLKFGESVVGFLKGMIKNYAYQSFTNKVKVLLSKGTLKNALKDLDYQAYGGVPLLGINGISMIGHGSSSILAMKNMVLSAKKMYDKQLVKKIEESVNFYKNKE